LTLLTLNKKPVFVFGNMKLLWY